MEIQEKVLLKDFTFWRIGGPADFFCLPTSVDEVREALQFARVRGLPVTILGGGTNVLISDDGIEGLVIGMKKLVGVTTEVRDGRVLVEAMAGAGKSELVKIFLKRKLPPALFLCGLPGDVGGGVVMNAGVGEMIVPREFVEITDWVDVIDINSSSFDLNRFSRDQLQWSYRHTNGWQPGVVVRAGISWADQPDTDIQSKVKAATKNRLDRQPLELPSCGSTFKNPPGKKAGALIEEAGLKGLTIGGAQVSLKHANFIVNINSATAHDVRQIIDRIKSEVKSQFGVELETEVKMLGR